MNISGSFLKNMSSSPCLIYRKRRENCCDGIRLYRYIPGAFNTGRQRIEMKKRRFPKINSIFFGGKCLGIGVLIGGVFPVLIWLLFHIFLWELCAIGGIILAGFFIVFAIEMHQDFGRIPYYERHLRETIPFDPKKQYAVIRSSICTGEKVAGFKNMEDGHFTEVMLIRSGEDEKRFRKIYDLDTVKTEY